MVGVDKAIIARYKVGKEHYEILVDSDLAVDFKHGKNVDIYDILAERRIYMDAAAGLLASEIKLEQVFQTKDVGEIAKQIIQKGLIQITTEHRHKLTEEKRKKVIQIVHTNCYDPRTNLPHPMTRIEAAVGEIKFNIDPFKPAEQQAQEVIKLLKPILPIKTGNSEFELKIPHKFVGSSKQTIKTAQTIKEHFDSEGNWFVTISIPGGMTEEFFDKLNNITHGEMLSKKL
ncbi:MAG: ribosome assembly factor SBDS [Candidatus Woesearchaeota archaeon]|jgi:ribosome maturation protein SDO1